MQFCERCRKEGAPAQEGFYVGEAGTAGYNCLIHSVLQLLVHEAQLLPAVLAATTQTLTAQGAACRAALQALPQHDARRPVCRDVVTNAVRRDLPDEAHDYAYLQCDVHVEFIIDFSWHDTV